MSKEKTRLTTALVSGRKRTHGGYTFLTTGKLPIHKKYIEQYLTAWRMGVIKDLGPTEEDLTTLQITMIDGLVSMLGIVRCIEEHIRENSVMVGHNLAPALRSHYLAYKNSIARACDKLGINEKAVPGERTIEQIKREYIDKHAKEDGEAEEAERASK